ncbi:MAG TPA: PilZ domain-containing protein [Pseudomonadales bacterium]|nr:PilZ domain-containing protein [Pseudomonadales bacterium]
MAYVDKRDHYRIEDDIQVGWKVVHAGEVDAGRPIEHFETSPLFPLLTELYQLNLEAEDILREVTAQNRQLGGFLHNLDRRVALLARAIVTSEAGTSSLASPARISEGGISFITGQLLPTGTHLAMKLMFSSRLLGIACFGEVRHSRLVESRDDYLVGARFVNLDDATRTLIQRHVLHRQAEERRARLRQDAGI